MAENSGSASGLASDNTYTARGSNDTGAPQGFGLTTRTRGRSCGVSASLSPVLSVIGG
jgi:hypothetical protein